jgi:hypothetical protein
LKQAVGGVDGRLDSIRCVCERERGKEGERAREYDFKHAVGGIDGRRPQRADHHRLDSIISDRTRVERIRLDVHTVGGVDDGRTRGHIPFALCPVTPQRAFVLPKQKTEPKT